MISVTTADDRTLAVREGGAPNGVPVFVLHGTPGSGTLYEPHMRDAEAKGIRLISYDRPGYGGSTRDKGRNVSDCAHDIGTIADALELERFCVWGISGGGPHALAAAALLPRRVAAAATLASVAPFDAEGLDFLAGMGETNIEEFHAVIESEEKHIAILEIEREQLLKAKPEDIRTHLLSLLGPADVEVTTGALAEYLLENMRTGVEPGLDGWLDDDVVFVWPWGFDVTAIHTPVLHWHGEQDKFVPVAHARWLAERIPGVESHISAEDGHLTLAENRVPEVHDWLLERFGS